MTNKQDIKKNINPFIVFIVSAKNNTDQIPKSEEV